MSEGSEPSYVETIVNSVTDKLQDLPATQPSDATERTRAPVRKKIFNRERPLHEIFGGGKPADVILWRRKYATAGIISAATIIWFLFEKSGYTLLTILSDALLILIVVLFVWSNAAVFLNRPPPPISELQLSEETVVSFALTLREQINKVLAAAHDIALGKDFKLFLKVVVVLWGLSIVGGWFHFLTLAYLCILLIHTVPVFYEKYEDKIEQYAQVATEQAQNQYRKIDATVLSRIPRPPQKEKFK